MTWKETFDVIEDTASIRMIRAAFIANAIVEIRLKFNYNNSIGPIYKEERSLWHSRAYHEEC